LATPRNGEPAVGGYGFRLVSAAEALDFADLVAVSDEAPRIEVRWRHASVRETYEHVDERRVGMGARGASGFWADRDASTVTFDLDTVPTADELVHPLLTIPLSVFARWRGDLTLHAGAFHARSGAWAVLGVREAGKSTLLAALGERGMPIVADDLLVVQGSDVLAGPRCVDLRPDAAPHFPAARAISTGGRRPRFRLTTPTGPERAPLRGFVVPRWHDEPRVTLRALTTAERLRLLYGQEYIALLGATRHEGIFDLLGLPAYELSRPRDWAATDETVARLLELTRSVAEPATPPASASASGSQAAG
jgi:hypothetical protein